MQAVPGCSHLIVMLLCGQGGSFFLTLHTYKIYMLLAVTLTTTDSLRSFMVEQTIRVNNYALTMVIDGLSFSDLCEEACTSLMIALFW